MDFNSILIGTDDKEAMVEYYTKGSASARIHDESYAAGNSDPAGSTSARTPRSRAATPARAA